MARSPVDQAAALLSEQIQTLDEERQRLERALSSLTGSDGRSGTTRRPRRRRKRARRGQRQAQLIAYLQSNPGSKPSEIAKAIGTSPNSVHALLRKGRTDKMVRKQLGGGYALTAAGKAAA
jgi:hypothetical protein